MDDLVKLLDIKARYEADALKYIGYRHYYVDLYPMMRGQYVNIRSQSMTVPWSGENTNGMQTMVASRMSRLDGHYRVIFTCEVSRIASEEEILAHVLPMIEYYLAGEIEALSPEDTRVYLSTYLMDREMRAGAHL